MMKIDLKKELKDLYRPPAGRPVVVDVPTMQFVMIDGQGDPNTGAEFGEAVNVLYGLSYTLKFTLRKEHGIDYGVLPLEALWWTSDMATFAVAAKFEWHWTAMIMQPPYVNQELFEKAVRDVEKKKLAALPKARLVSFAEGLSAQVMHLGPYAAEEPTIRRLHEFVATSGYRMTGKHHEIYLSDPRRTAAEKLQTVIRQPIVPMAVLSEQ